MTWHDPQFGMLVEHAITGGIFALTGGYARRFCKHFRHQLMLGTLMVLVESYFVVGLVG